MVLFQNKRIKYCDTVNISKGNTLIPIHFYCKSGLEEKLYDELPIWITKLGEVTIGIDQVFVSIKFLGQF